MLKNTTFLSPNNLKFINTFDMALVGCKGRKKKLVE